MSPDNLNKQPSIDRQIVADLDISEKISAAEDMLFPEPLPGVRQAMFSVGIATEPELLEKTFELPFEFRKSINDRCRN